ncbi:MAG: hypothetical protein H0U73_11065 [Tatlockia sp.]|nr:hypothetical protein [Tatlockia sp.]
MKTRFERFEKYIGKLEARKEQFKRVKVADNVFFGNSENNKKIHKIDQLLNHLIKYEKKTSALVQENPENQKFYENGFEALINLLENVDRKKPSELKNEDFWLIVCQDVRYKKTNLDILQEAGIWAGIGAAIGGICGFIISSVLMFTLPPLWGLQVTFLGAELFGFAGVLIGAAIGALIGFLAGCCIVPFLKKESLINDTYRDGRVFDSNLLKETYEVLNTGTGIMNNDISVNDENNELDDEKFDITSSTQYS